MLYNLLPDQVWVHVDSFVSRKNYPIRIFAPTKELIKDGEEVPLTIDYPLNNPVTFKVQYSFDVNAMVGQICDKYKEIYAEEEATSKKKAMPLYKEIPGCPLMNRNTTDGIHGIWGHEIGDLWIEGLIYDTNKKELILEMGS